MCKYFFSMGIFYYIKFFTFFLHLSIFMCKYLFNMGITFYIKFFYFLFIFIIFMCKYLFGMEISFYINFFTFFLYLSIFMCKYLIRVCNCLRYQVNNSSQILRVVLAWFLLLKMPYLGNFFLY